MKTVEHVETGFVYTDYSKEESESLFGPLKQKIFAIPEGYDAVYLPNGRRPESKVKRLFRDTSWPAVVLPQDYILLKRDAFLDGRPATQEELWDLYGEREENPDYYRDDITPFLEFLQARGTKRIIRWGMHGEAGATELPVLPYKAHLDAIDLMWKDELDDPVAGYWLFHDQFGDWGIYSNYEDFGFLGGALPLMKAYIDRMGGWKTYRDCVDKEFEERKDADEGLWSNFLVSEIYCLARWSYPFSDGVHPFWKDSEPYEPLAD